VKHSVKKGTETLIIKQFKDSLENQINTSIITALKDEEWLLESVGLGTLKSNNLLPTIEQPIKAKDIYEAFVKFDDKPMITGHEAVSKSILKYCYNGEYCIATGDGKIFTNYFFKRDIPFFDVTDSTYWLTDKSFEPQQKEPGTASNTDERNTALSLFNDSGIPASADSKGDTGTIKKLKSITISGKVAFEQYTQLFTSFVMPLAHNNIEIEIRIKGKSTSSKPLTETSQEYKIVKESAKQLGLNFEEE
jgi:hypothetical protein